MMLVEQLLVLLLGLFVLSLADYGTGSENMGEIISSLENISEILFNNGYNSWGNTIRKAIALLKEQETVVQKTGHWIWLQFCANEGVYCSECHTKMFDSYPMKKKLSQFCGHCGAKMVDEVESR